MVLNRKLCIVTGVLLTSLLPAVAIARDFGTLGAIFPIQEPSILETIMGRLTEMEDSGEMDILKDEMQDKTRAYAVRPRPVGGIGRTEIYRSYEVDLSITVSRDLADQNGQVFARAGTKVNPLDYSSYNQRLILIDGDDEDQVRFALSVAADEPVKIILVAGEPLTLTKSHDVQFWFDQEGVFANKFLLQNVPAVITRSYPNMLVEEIPVKKSKEDASDG
ncbi:MAG: type-F conjugative transfer system protein TraW [Pseudoruegeria sp.]